MAGTYSQRVAAVTGWIALLGITIVLIAFPVALAGTPPTGATSLQDAMAYFRHPEFAVSSAILAVFVGAVAVIPFGIGLRSLTAGGDSRASVFAEIGFYLLVATIPVYVVSGALGATLTAVANGDETVFDALFRLYQLLYNGAADVLEGAWIGAFSLAGVFGTLPRWLAWLGLATALSRWVKAFMPVATIPDAIIPVSGVLFIAWFLGVVSALTRDVRRPRTELAVATAAPG
jgi:hypothetical protein